MIAARLHVDEDALWRAMPGEMRALLTELASTTEEANGSALTAHAVADGRAS